MASMTVGVNSYCENQNVAVALAQYLASEEAQLAHYEMTGIVPCNTKLIASDTLKNDALVQAQTNTIANTAIIQPTNNTFNYNWWSNAASMANMILNGYITEDNAAYETDLFEDAINGR